MSSSGQPEPGIEPNLEKPENVSAPIQPHSLSLRGEEVRRRMADNCQMLMFYSIFSSALVESFYLVPVNNLVAST